jgi:hypothetical protein
MGTPLLAHMGGGMVIFFPLGMLGAAVFFVVTALRDGSDKQASTRTLPTSPFSRQVHAALRQQRPERSTEAAPPERLPRRRSSPLQLVEGGGGENNVARIPQRFEPAPPARRKTS